MQLFVHYSLHLLFPIAIAFFLGKKDWKKTYLILLATMLVDLDHLVADPIFDADRCSINFHFLHTYHAMIGYFVLLFLKRPLRIVGIGLLFHMFTDLTDCLMTHISCQKCLSDAPAGDVLVFISDFLKL